MRGGVAVSRNRANLVVAVAVVAVAASVFLFLTERPRLWRGLPDLRPVLDATSGYAWERDESDGGYSWILREVDWQPGQRPRSGLGLYISYHPGPADTPHAVGRQTGRVGQYPVEWFHERDHVTGNPVCRAVYEYRHGRRQAPVAIHVWVWADTTERLNDLLTRLETLTFVDRE